MFGLEAFRFPLHCAALLLGIIELSFFAYIISLYNGPSPSDVNFMLFNAIWTLLVTSWAAFAPANFVHEFAILAADVITAIFWFAGSIALAADFGAPACHGSTACGVTEAGIAFGFFLWVIFTLLIFADWEYRSKAPRMARSQPSRV